MGIAKMKKFQFKDIAFLIISIAWIFLVFIDYLNKQMYDSAFIYFKQPKTALAIIVLSLLVGLGFSKFKNVFSKYLMNGLGMLLLIFISTLILALGFSKWAYTPTTPSEGSLYAVWSMVYIIPLLFTVWSSYAMGDLIFKYSKLYQPKIGLDLIKIAIGIMLITFLLFILAIFGLLFNFIIIPILAIPIIVNYKGSLDVLKRSLIKPWVDKKSKVNFLTGVLLTLLITFLALNFSGVISPFPSGFDSRNYYVNISKLLHDYNGLVEGFQPYNWSLFMSLGIIAFGNITTTMHLSFIGIIFTLWGGNIICRKYFNLPINLCLFILLQFSVTPAIYNQMFVELKIDFGLLFIQICCLLLIMEMIVMRNLKGSFEGKEIWSLIILFSIFCGYGLGVKLTHLYLMFAFFMLIWSLYCQYFGFLGIFFMILFVIFFAGLDEISGMGRYHIGIFYQRYAFFGIGLLFMIISFIRNRKDFLDLFKISAVVTTISILVFVPWVFKNYADSDKISIRTLVMGNNPGPPVHVKTINETYRKLLREKNQNKNKNKNRK